MNRWVKIIWITTAVLLLLNAFDALVLNLLKPMLAPTLDTFFARVARAFISIAVAAAIIVYLKHKHD